MEIATKECIWHKRRKDLFRHLVGMQLSKKRLSDYNCIFNRLEEFMQRRCEKIYSVRIGRAFTKEMCDTLGSDSLKVIKTVIRRLNDFMAEEKCSLQASGHKLKLPKLFKIT